MRLSCIEFSELIKTAVLANAFFVMRFGVHLSL